MKKAGLIFLLIVGLAAPSYAALDPLKRGMQLYKKHHYKDAVQILYTYLPSAESKRRAKARVRGAYAGIPCTSPRRPCRICSRAGQRQR